MLPIGDSQPLTSELCMLSCSFSNSSRPYDYKHSDLPKCFVIKMGAPYLVLNHGSKTMLIQLKKETEFLNSRKYPGVQLGILIP